MALFHSERIEETQVQKPKMPTTKPTPIGGAVAAATGFIATLYGFLVVTIALALAVLIVPFTTTSSNIRPESSPTTNDSSPLGSFAVIHRNFEQILRRLDSLHTALFERKKTFRNFGVIEKLASKNFSEHTSATELCSETEFSESFSEDVWPPQEDDITPFTSMYHPNNSRKEEEQLRRRRGRDSAITKQKQQQQRKNKNRDRLSVSGHMKKKTKDRLSIKDRLSSLSLHSSNHNKKNCLSSIQPLPKVQRSRTDPTLSKTRSKMTSRSDFRSDFFLVDASKRSSRDEPLKPYQQWD